MTTPDSATAPAYWDPPRLGFIARLAYLLLILGTAVLAVSGIGTFLQGKAPMTHWVLMFHVGASPAFSVGLALVALTWTPGIQYRSGFQRLCYWLLLLAGLVVILSGVLPMTPLFGTEGQHLLYLTHRYSGMLAAGALALHLLSLILGRRQ